MPRLALITGASAGIGKRFAERLAEEGHDLLLVARNLEPLQAVANALAARHGVRAEAVPADLSRRDGRNAVADRIARADDLVMLVNSAGIGTRGKLVNRPVAEQEAMLELHVHAPMVLTHAALPGMIARGTGTIINVSSVASYTAAAGNVNYCATKAYERVFSEALALELEGTGVHVQALCPGFTHTEFHQRARIDKGKIPAFLWLAVGRVVDESLAQAARRGPVVCVPSRRFRLIVFLIKVLPEFLLRGLRRRYGKTRT